MVSFAAVRSNELDGSKLCNHRMRRNNWRQLLQRSIKVVDIDQLPRDADGANLKFAVAKEAEAFRRWRPALVRGDTARAFLQNYFTGPAMVPWAGIVSMRAAEVITDGLTLQRDALYVGKSLMYPLEAFPYAHSPLRFEIQPDGRYAVDLPGETIHLAGTTANIVCDGWQIFGHWLVDVLPRLHRIMTSDIEIDTFLLAGPPRDWQLRLLEAVGLDLDRCRFVDLTASTVTCDHLVIPTYDRYNSEIRPDLVRVHQKLRDTFLGQSPPPATRNLFVSRGDWGGSRPLNNRAAIEAAYADLGFEVVRPEILSFPDQIRLFASARSVAGECGSGMHNAIFCGPGTNVAVLQSETNLNFLQSQIAMMLDQQVFYVVGPAESEGSDAFSIDIQDARYVAGILKG